MKHGFAAALALVSTLSMGQTPAPAASPAPAAATAAAAASPMQRLRGTVESFDGATLVMRERSGELLRLVVNDSLNVSEVYAIEWTAIKPGSYIGSAAMPMPDGGSRALEVLVFPEDARGVGEGHREWDLLPGSTMTNATVASVGDVVAVNAAAGAAGSGRSLTLRYPGGEKTVQVPAGTPVVTFKPGDRSLLVAGAKVIVTAQLRAGTPTALRVVAGRNGFAPPM